jgi:hypothetical protein
MTALKNIRTDYVLRVLVASQLRIFYLPSLYRNLKIKVVIYLSKIFPPFMETRYVVYENTALVPIPSHMNAAKTLTFCFF